METIIRIKKNKPAFKALILLAKELEKNEPTSISISEGIKKREKLNLITPIGQPKDPFLLFDQFEDFPTIEALRTQAWPKSYNC